MTSRTRAEGTTRRTVTTFGSYDDAERAVDFLSDHDFPVEHVSIVGTGLRYVEQVVRRTSASRATLNGLAYGGLLGLFWGLLFGLFFTVDSGSFFGVVVYSVLVGLVFGALFGLIGHSGRRDFESVGQTVADRYDLQVDDSYADAAEHLVVRMAAEPASVATTTT